jgi:hypothetical protein
MKRKVTLVAEAKKSLLLYSTIHTKAHYIQNPTTP